MTASSPAKPRIGTRDLFPDLEPTAYLNHGASSPPSEPVREAFARVLSDFARRGIDAGPDWAERRSVLRHRIAQLIGAAPGSIALVPNTSYGVAIIASSLRWKAGDRILLVENDFPANVCAWLEAAKRLNLEPVFLPWADFARPDESDLSRLEMELRRGARLVAVSLTHFSSGLRMPVERIARLCNAAGAELFVDAIQCLGAMPFAVDGIDYVACGGHKWLMGPAGTGFLYVNPERVDSLSPALTGWLSYDGATDLLALGEGHLDYGRPLRPGALRFEAGTLNSPGFAGLHAAVTVIEELRIQAIHAHILDYLERLERGLTGIGLEVMVPARDPRRSCILSAVVPRDIDGPSLIRCLQARGVSCSLPDGRLRFCPHWPNRLDEVPQVLGAIGESLDELRR